MNRTLFMGTLKANYSLVLGFTAFTLILSAIIFPGVLAIGKYLMLNMVTYMASLVVGSIAFLLSCIFNESRISTAFSGGIGGVLIIFHMISGLSEDTEVLKFFTIYTLVDVDRSLNETGFAFGVSGIMLIVCVLLFIIAVRVFDKKSLTI